VAIIRNTGGKKKCILPISMQTILQSRGTSNIGCMALIIKKDSVLMGLRNYTKDVWKDASVWTCPGGRSDSGETLEETLRREVYEEVGIDDLMIEDFIAKSPGAQERDEIYFFYCTTDQEPQLMEPEKFSEWKWVPVQEYIENDSYGGFSPYTRKENITYLTSLKK